MAQEGTVPSPSEALGAGRPARELSRAPAAAAAGRVDRLLRRAVLRRLSALREGRLTLADDSGRESFGAAGADTPLSAEIRVRDPRFYRRVALGGTIGAAEAYALGHWDADDLTTVVRILARNLDGAEQVESGLARLGRPLHRFVHRLRGNSRAGSLRNIAAHYDLGDDFFELFLDPTMTYSCAVFPTENASLEEASRHKIDLVCRKLDLGPDDEIVEIGTGWGSFAVHAAQRYGCRVVTTTLSRRQYERARRLVAAAGLEERVTVLREDYRDLPRLLGRRFDKLASIEMIEAVGHRQLDRYFEVLSGLLKPDGMALVQAIVIADQRYESYRRSVDFIQRYIFPGGLLPSVAAIADRIARVTDLRLFHLEDITPHYARTLERWRRRLLSNHDRARNLGFAETLLRMWEFYFCYCEGGFRERVIGDVQLLLTKPRNRRAPLASEV